MPIIDSEIVPEDPKQSLPLICPIAARSSQNQLHESKSSPFLKTMDDGKPCQVDTPANLLSKIRSVQFNAGCSSSSTDLDKLMDFYNDHSDDEVLAQWMNIYEEQKSDRAANSNLNEDKPCSGRQAVHRDISDSADNLFQNSTHKVAAIVDALSKDAPFNRSMDFSMHKNLNEGFFALEKCRSADFPSKYDMPLSRLIRSKEMPNIADVDNDLEC